MNDEKKINSETNFVVSQDLEGVNKRIKSAVKSAGGNNFVSEKSGINLRTLNNYISGRSEPKINAIVLIAETCGVSIEWLATGQDPDPAINYPESELGIANPPKPGLIDGEMLSGIFKRTTEAMDKHGVNLPIEALVDICVATYNSVNDPDLAGKPEDERFKLVGEAYERAGKQEEEK